MLVTVLFAKQVSRCKVVFVLLQAHVLRININTIANVLVLALLVPIPSDHNARELVLTTTTTLVRFVTSVAQQLFVPTRPVSLPAPLAPPILMVSVPDDFAIIIF